MSQKCPRLFFNSPNQWTILKASIYFCEAKLSRLRQSVRVKREEFCTIRTWRLVAKERRRRLSRWLYASWHCYSTSNATSIYVLQKKKKSPLRRHSVVKNDIWHGAGEAAARPSDSARDELASQKYESEGLPAWRERVVWCCSGANPPGESVITQYHLTRLEQNLHPHIEHKFTPADSLFN